jgi:phosphoribosyl-ATP pyrophosphohydrolase
MVEEKVLPLIVQDSLGTVLGLKAMNPKAFQKSRENGFLWIYLTDNGRVLPFREDLGPGSLCSVKETEYGYLARVELPGETGTEKSSYDNPAQRDKDIASDPGITTSVPGRNVLSALAAVIASRHRDLPEGSYTTHLFKSGADKIRKKLGEEAVELILARERGDVIYEAADLFYHTLVLLESLEIPLAEIFEELERRS